MTLGPGSKIYRLFVRPMPRKGYFGSFAPASLSEVDSAQVRYLAERGGIRTPDAGITGVSALEGPPH